MSPAEERSGGEVAPRDPCVEQAVAEPGNRKAAQQQDRAQLQQLAPRDARISGLLHTISSTAGHQRSYRLAGAVFRDAPTLSRSVRATVRYDHVQLEVTDIAVQVENTLVLAGTALARLPISLRSKPEPVVMASTVPTGAAHVVGQRVLKKLT